MSIKEGSKVKVEYEGKFETGEVFDSSKRTGEEKPLEFTVGEKQVIPGFENAVIGMKLNEEKSVEISPEDGYGERKEELKQEVPRTALPKDQEPKEGMMLIMSSPEGQQFPARISEVTADAIFLDLNHPLAGKKLLFKIKVVGIDEAETAAAI
tara:strand:- start:57 stop:515 length:459 start_codon:yes stop_codon:yes gene_type:complete